ncbi:hypothetical protein MPH_10212 [Macrophomina phaseolina MS6]|uniref:Uncharacterized protein n=1 Tax=Macrophomina phaseolina (strain MS6) TaxID=1126212 RepID=K2RDM0_MACPH|nr:hypothetical protein MPH_10212 [Macrophomina phaseolina MS6]
MTTKNIEDDTCAPPPINCHSPDAQTRRSGARPDRPGETFSVEGGWPKTMVRTNCLHPKIRKQTAEETQEEHGFPSESVGGSTPHNGEEGTYRAGGLSGGDFALNSLSLASLIVQIGAEPSCLFVKSGTHNLFEYLGLRCHCEEDSQVKDGKKAAYESQNLLGMSGPLGDIAL